MAPRTVCVCGQGVKVSGGGWQHEDGTVACIIDGTHYLEREPDPLEPHCDFCNKAEVGWIMETRSRVNANMMVYDDETLEVAQTQTHSLSEDWAACEECQVLIAHGAWDSMATRCLMSLGQTEDSEHWEEMRSIVLEMWAEVYKGFVEWRKVGEGAVPR